MPLNLHLRFVVKCIDVVKKNINKELLSKEDCYYGDERNQWNELEEEL